MANPDTIVPPNKTSTLIVDSDIDLAAYRLKFNYALLKGETPSYVVTRNLADSAYYSLKGMYIHSMGNIYASGTIQSAYAFVGPYVSRDVENAQFQVRGGLTNAAQIDVYGKDHSTYPGRIYFFTTNAAKTNVVTAALIEGVTDTPYLDLIHGLKANSILEHTVDAGVTIDGVLCKDNYITATGLYTSGVFRSVLDESLTLRGGTGYSAVIDLNGQNESPDPGVISFYVPNAIKTGWVRAAYIQGVSNNPYVAIIYELKTEIINEGTSGTGVTVDGLLIKDGLIAVSGVPEHDHTKHTSRTRTIYLPVRRFYNSTLAYQSSWNYVYHQFANNVDSVDLIAETYLPPDLVSLTAVKIIIVNIAGVAAGNVYLNRQLTGATSDESVQANNSATTETFATTLTGNIQRYLNVTGTLNLGLFNAGDRLSIRLKRYGANAADTVEGTIDFIGMLLEYTADM